MIRKIMYVAVAATLFMLTLSSASAQQRRQVMLDKVVAVVGGSAILHSELVEYAEALVSQRRQMGYTSDRDPLDESLEALLEQKLLYNQALIDSVEVNTSDIASRIEVYVQAQIAEEGGIAQLEAKEHMPIYTYRELLRQRYEEQAYAQAMRNDVVSRVTVVPGEVERFYKHVDKDSLPVIGEQYVYAHITKFPSSLKDAQQRTKERLLDMRERVITGQTKFSVLARMYSLDGSAMYGGEMEPMPASYFVRPFAEALEKLKPGQISEIVETEFGFHIIELIDEPKNGMYHYRHILLKPVYTLEEELEPTKFLDSLSLMIKSDSITFEEAAREHSQDDLTKMNGGLVTNHDILMHYNANDVKYTATKFRREDFSDRQPDYINLIQMKPGDVSTAFVTADVNGNSISKIVKLLEIVPTHSASLEEDYLSIEEMALEDKKGKVFDKWLKEKIDGLYIYIDPEFREGEFEYPNWVK